MSGAKTKKGLLKYKQTGGKETEEQDRDSELENGSELNDIAQTMLDVSKQINELNFEFKQSLMELRGEVRKDVKAELDSLKNDILQKLQQTNEETPYPARMRMQWDSGTRLYQSAAEVVNAMEEKSLAVPNF
ncbi:hypothetical protein MHYP_G00280270 [Metynnis hypsauchen]